jgi:hypothetical protein
VQAARDEEVAVAEAEDLREEHQEQKRAQERRDADVRDRRPGKLSAACAARSERDPIEQRVERQCDEVVRDDRAEEPGDDLKRRRSWKAVEPADDRGAPEQQARDQRE